jgi:hypothetical protein
VVTLLPRGGLRTAPATAGRGGIRAATWLAIAFVIVAAGLWALHGNELAGSIAAFPPLAAAAAVLCQFAWLCLRGEAWRLSLNAVARDAVPRAGVHAANGAAFLAGVVQAATTVPVRALTLRRLAPRRSPSLERVLVADAPVIALEVTLMAIVLVIAAATAPVLPAWAAVLTLMGAVAVLAILFGIRERLGNRGLVAGLSVLADPRRRLPLCAVATAMTLLGLTRAWVVLVGFGLPHGFGSAAVLLAALGLLGALPIGLGSSPGATLAVFGATDASTAAAAGIAMAMTSLAAITLYGSLSFAGLALARRRATNSLEAG